MSDSRPTSQRNRTKKVTLKDVADALNVSKGTVSMALNGNPLVAKSTRQAVLEKIDELGYIYDRRAAGLTTGVTGLVGLAVHNLANPYFTRVCEAIEAELERNGQIALLCHLDESREKQARFVRALVEQNADGLIICPAAGTTPDDLLGSFGGEGALVLFARELDGENFDFVGNDDTRAMELATGHVIEMGHCRIALICGGDVTSVARRRRAGFLAAMDKAGLTTRDELMMVSTIHPDSGAAAARALMRLDKPPTAIVCFTDYVALGAISALHEMGYRPGEDVAIIGCDGIAEGEHAYLKLSTINVQKRQIGETAARLLIQRLGEPDAPVERVITEPVPLFRSSCGEERQNQNENKPGDRKR